MPVQIYHIRWIRNSHESIWNGWQSHNQRHSIWRWYSCVILPFFFLILSKHKPCLLHHMRYHFVILRMVGSAMGSSVQWWEVELCTMHTLVDQWAIFSPWNPDFLIKRSRASRTWVIQRAFSCTENSESSFVYVIHYIRWISFRQTWSDVW